MTVSAEFTDEELDLAMSHASEHGISAEEALKRTLFDRIDDE